MKRTVLMLVLTLAVGIALGMIGNQVLSAQQAPGKATDLLKTDAVGMDGKEVLVTLVELAPRGSSGKHTHPGHEVAYVLEGSGVSEVEGKDPVVRKAGTVTYILPNQVHESKNDSATETLKVLIFRIHEKGQPVVNRRVTEAYFWK